MDRTPGIAHINANKRHLGRVFQIVMNASTGEVTKTCTNDEAPGCNGTENDTVEAGTW